MYRALHASSAYLLEGTGALPPAEPLDEWLASMRLAPTDGARTGLTPLLYAVLTGDIELVETILTAHVATGNIDINRPLRRSYQQFDGWLAGVTPLHVACMHRDQPSIVRLLLQHQANPRARARLVGNAPLHDACCKGHVGNIDVLLAHDETLFDMPHAFGAKPAAMTLFYGQRLAFEHLCISYPHLMVPYVTGNTAGPTDLNGLCTYAVRLIGDVPTLQAAIDAGAAVNHVEPRLGLYAPMNRVLAIAADALVALSVRKPPSRFAQCNSYAGTRMSALHVAAFVGNLGAVEALITAGADVASTKHPYGMAPLHLASMEGHEQAVRRLLRAKASPHTVDKRGRTPAHWAARRKHAELAAELAGVVASERASGTG